MNRLSTRILYAVFAFAAWLAWALRIRRGVVMENLRLAFPEKTEDERREIARATYRNLGRVAAEFLAIQRASDEEIATAFEREGWDIYERTGSAMALGWVGVAMFIPVFLLFLPAGQWADRYSRRSLMMISFALASLASLALAFASWTNASEIWIYLAVAA